MKKTLIPLIILLLFAGTAEAKFWKVIKARILAAQVEGVESAGPVTAGTTVNSLYQLLGAEADPSDFPNAMAIFNDYPGAGAGNTAHIGLVIKTQGADAQRTIGIDIYPYMFGDRDATGINIEGQGGAAKLGDFYGVKVVSTTASNSSKQYGFYCDIQNGLSVFCYYGVNGEFYQADQATFGDDVDMYAAVNLINLTGIYQFRTLAGDGSADLDIWSIYDGSTLVNKIWFDDTGSNIEVTGGFQAQKLMSTSDISGQSLTSVNRLKLTTGLVESVANTLSLIMDNGGNSGDDVSMSMLDDNTIYATHATDGATYVITSVQGDLELAAKAGSAVVISGSTLKGAGTNLGWVIQTGGDTACDTTCTGACVFGFEDTSNLPVACNDASADRCLCTP